ncbi:MAG TPA: PfkB family carbohydrate kinase [Terracidiphilus sp.]|nr:PfkB family carbohydrate kinase [Terracidiphilus sp.]
MASGIFVGLSTIDVVYGVDEFPAADTKIVARSQDVFVGGPATNAAVAFARLGGESALVTAVGRNPLGVVVREELKNQKVQLVDLNPEFDGLPSLSSVTVDRDGRRNVVSADATGVKIPPAKVDASLCGAARIVMVDGHFIDACQAWASVAKAQGKPVVLDGGIWKDGMEELLKSVQTAICSANFQPPGCAGRDQVIAFLKARGVANIAVTSGAEAIHFVSGQSSGTIAVPQVEVVDTMGASDILHGAYCFFATTGRGFIESLAEATKIASDSCRYAGTREWMKHLTGEHS